LEKYVAAQMRFHEQYIPGFKDDCAHANETRYGRTRDSRLTNDIVVAASDAFVPHFREAAESFVGAGAKTGLIFRQHTNMCPMAVLLYCREAKLDFVVVKDVAASAWSYRNQKKTHPSHHLSNIAVEKYIETHFGCTALSYDILRAALTVKTRKSIDQFFEQRRLEEVINE
jgi:hypothetical protein